MNTVSGKTNPVLAHKRDVRWRIVTPVIAGSGVLLLVLIGLIYGVASGGMAFKQVTVAMGMVFTAFIALPLVILCLIPYMLFAVAAVGVGMAHQGAQRPIRALRGFTGTMSEKTGQFVPKLARPLLEINVRLMRWERVVSAWASPTLAPGKDEHDE